MICGFVDRVGILGGLVLMGCEDGGGCGFGVEVCVAILGGWKESDMVILSSLMIIDFNASCICDIFEFISEISSTILVLNSSCLFFQSTVICDDS